MPPTSASPEEPLEASLADIDLLNEMNIENEITIAQTDAESESKSVRSISSPLQLDFFYHT